MSSRKSLAPLVVKSDDVTKYSSTDDMDSVCRFLSVPENAIDIPMNMTGNMIE